MPPSDPPRKPRPAAFAPEKAGPPPVDARQLSLLARLPEPPPPPREEPAGDGDPAQDDDVDADVLSPARAPAVPVELQALIGLPARAADVPRKHRVFVNRSLRMDQVEHIGFDMDYTLAIYDQPRLEALSVECTLRKLVEGRGYPPEVLGLDYDPTFAIRGLVVDKRYGNLIKMDRYNHAGRVYHGRTLLPDDERHRLYRTQRIRLSAPRYAWIDTLFALPEAVMFARLVELFDARPGRVDYQRLWQDIREAIDEAHRDETIKRVIKADIARYFERDPDLGPTLHKLRSAGKRLFLLTNSLWDYTDAVMRHLLDGQLPGYPSWRQYFDLIVVGGQKPAFFTERRPFVEIDPQSGVEKGHAAMPLLRGHVYQGGNIVDLEASLGRGGDRVLYVGDHIYGDMLRAKKASVWRTAMIVQELESELDLAQQNNDKSLQIDRQDRYRRRLESEIAHQSQVLRSLQKLADDPGHAGDALLAQARQDARRNLEALRQALRRLEEAIGRLEDEVDRAFNSHWGPVFKEGVENSRFGEQVEAYACVYTSRVSNFLAYSPLQYFRSPRSHMPHELV